MPADANTAPDSPDRDYVFVSYAREDRDRLGPLLLEPLRYRGIGVWFDEHLTFDSSWWQTVRDRLKGAHAVVVVMTDHVLDSQWVPREVTLAEEAGKPVFPILAGERALPELDDRQMLVLGEGEAVTPEWLDELAGRVRAGRLRRQARFLATRAGQALAVLAALITVGLFVAPLFASDPLPTLDGFYNLGVAEFDDPADAGLRDDLAAEVDRFEPGLLAGVENALELNRADSGETLRVLPVSAALVPRRVAGSDTRERRAAAAALAAETGADLLLYGSIVNDGALLTVQPELYLAPSALPRAEELAGRVQLSPIVEDISRPGAALSLRTEVATLGRHLAGLLLLVDDYDSERWQEALDVVSDLREGGFSEAGLLGVLEGNLLGKLGRLDEARAAYEAALGTPYAARAELGRAQVAYSEALDDADGCGDGLDAAAMARARDAYGALRDAPADDGANVAVKAVFGEARARVCLAVAAGADDPVAAEQLDEVVAAFEETSPPDGDLRELAAEAEALSGVLAGRAAGTPEEAEPSLDRLDRALVLSTFTDRRIAFHLAKLDLHIRVGDIESACAVLDDLEPLLGIRQTDEQRRNAGCPAG